MKNLLLFLLFFSLLTGCSSETENVSVLEVFLQKISFSEKEIKVLSEAQKDFQERFQKFEERQNKEIQNLYEEIQNLAKERKEFVERLQEFETRENKKVEDLREEREDFLKEQKKLEERIQECEKEKKRQQDDINILQKNMDMLNEKWSNTPTHKEVGRRSYLS